MQKLLSEIPLRRMARPQAMGALSSEERRKVYVILNLTVEALADGGLKTSGAFGEEPVWEDVRTSTR